MITSLVYQNFSIWFEDREKDLASMENWWCRLYGSDCRNQEWNEKDGRNRRTSNERISIQRSESRRFLLFSSLITLALQSAAESNFLDKLTDEDVMK